MAMQHFTTQCEVCHSVVKYIIMYLNRTQDERKALEVQRKRKADDEAVFKKAQDLKERKKVELLTALEEQSKIHHQRKIEEKKHTDEQVCVHQSSLHSILISFVLYQRLNRLYCLRGLRLRGSPKTWQKKQSASANFWSIATILRIKFELESKNVDETHLS